MKKEKYLCFQIAILALCYSNSLAKTGVFIKDKAPDFTFTSIDNKIYKLNDFKKKKALYMVFWATWCPNCKAEINNLKTIYKKYNKKGLKLLAINVGISDSLKKVKRYVKKYQLPYQVMFDKNQIITKKYSVVGVPTIIIIGKDGMIKYRFNKTPHDLDKHFSDIIGN